MKIKRRHPTITEDDVLRAIRMLRWVSRSTLEMYFGGAEKRIKALEVMLPDLERDGRLFSERQGGEKIYWIARKDNVKPLSMEHEAACADILVTLWRCRMGEGEVVPERAFRGFGIVPEAGIRYSEERNTMLILEYCTQSNFTHGGVMKSKITRYIKYLPQMEARFERGITVLFVLDIERSAVRKFVQRMVSIFGDDHKGYDGTGEREDGSAGGVPPPSYVGDTFPLNPFFFIDYQSFKSVPVGQALTAKIYFWNDGKEWRLTGND
jgi:hypothetical protein